MRSSSSRCADPGRRLAVGALLLLAAGLGAGCPPPAEEPPADEPSAPLARQRTPPPAPPLPARRLPGSAQATRPEAPPLVLPPPPELDDEVPIEEALARIHRRLELLHQRSEAPPVAPPPEVPRRRLPR